MKHTANEIFGIFEKFKRGECTYDRALEDVSKIIDKYSDNRPIVGYVKTNTLKLVFNEIISGGKVNSESPYMIDCKLHKNSMEDVKRMFNSMTTI